MSKKSRCRKRCDAEFALKPELRDGCRAYCNSNSTSFIDGFLGMINDADIIRRYGYDPNPESGDSLEGYLDPLNQRELENQRIAEQQALFKKILLGGAALVGLALLVLLFIKKK